MEYKDEYVCKGNGWLAFPHFIKIDYSNGYVHIEAWLKVLIPAYTMAN